MTCNRCGRTIKHPVYFGGVALGETCARAMGGVRRRRGRKSSPRDERQGVLFE
jgi:hypothetical protein